jgi:hypothetical protein
MQNIHNHNTTSLEYKAMLSGMALAGVEVNDNHIAQARNLHQQNTQKAISFGFVSPQAFSKRSG